MYEAIIFELPLDEGLSSKVNARMTELLADRSGLFPIIVSANSSWATGYIRHSVADEKLNLDSRQYQEELISFLDDEELLSPHRQGNGAFHLNVAGVDTLLCRNLSEMDGAAMDPYEAYRLRWMLAHGKSLQDLVKALSDFQYQDPDIYERVSDPVQILFEYWDRKGGFGDESWASKEDWERSKTGGAKTQKCASGSDAPLHLEPENLSPEIYGMVDSKGRLQSFLTLSAPSELNDGSGFGVYAIPINDEEYGSVVPYGEAVLLVWPDADAHASRVDPIIRSMKEFAPKQTMTNIWARAGVNISLTQDELMDVLVKGDKTGARVLESAVRDGRATFSGDSYVPESVREELLRSLGHDTSNCSDVDFSL